MCDSSFDSKLEELLVGLLREALNAELVAADGLLLEQRVLLEVTESAEEGIDLLAAHAKRSLGTLTAFLGVFLAAEDLGAQVHLLEAPLVHAAVDRVEQHKGQVDEEDAAWGELVEELVDEVVRLSEQEVTPIRHDIIAE